MSGVHPRGVHGRRRFPVWFALAGAAAVVLVTALALLATGVIRPDDRSADGNPGLAQPTASGASSAPVTLTGEQAGRAFLDGYVDPDGRVVRRDQGGDTVSEGQAYAMLVSVALGDRESFDRVWAWTKSHLSRPDGTLSWRWKDGRILDAESASDADLDAARALILAGSAFGDPDLRTEGARLGESILSVETARTDLGLILTAGSWVTQQPYAYNPSYASPVAFAVLGKATGEPRWEQLAEGSRAATRAVLAKSDLPPDWAQIHRDGTVDPMPGAEGRGNDGVHYSYDAARLPLRYAESCTEADVAEAARLNRALTRSERSPAVRDLGGQPLTDVSSPVAAVGDAAAAAAGGNLETASAALVQADHLQQQAPTYYGAAWDALGRLLLAKNDLGGCGKVTT